MTYENLLHFSSENKTTNLNVREKYGWTISDESSELSLDGVPALSSQSYDTAKKNSIINVNESIISLMLKLHSKYSNRCQCHKTFFFFVTYGGTELSSWLDCVG
jgi:hypothetical protein